MPINRHQLAASLLAATHIAERHTIAAFVVESATQPAPNPFPETSVGAVRQVWRQRAAEFQSFDIKAVGLSCLLTALFGMSVDEVLVQEILRAGPAYRQRVSLRRRPSDRRGRALRQAWGRSAGSPDVARDAANSGPAATRSRHPGTTRSLRPDGDMINSPGCPGRSRRRVPDPQCGLRNRSRRRSMLSAWANPYRSGFARCRTTAMEKGCS
ncbi:hypothetical protein ABIC20_007269 [Methylobacterium radiotolerans]|uniref:Uncharacterized protein n=1 Tax=Methylobacterium radiotolerans TaxID=31998 RepID=A0ABV2NTL8_9HYPH